MEAERRHASLDEQANRHLRAVVQAARASRARSEAAANEALSAASRSDALRADIELNVRANEENFTRRTREYSAETDRLMQEAQSELEAAAVADSDLAESMQSCQNATASLARSRAESINRSNELVSVEYAEVTHRRESLQRLESETERLRSQSRARSHSGTTADAATVATRQRQQQQQQQQQQYSSSAAGNRAFTTSSSRAPAHAASRPPARSAGGETAMRVERSPSSYSSASPFAASPVMPMPSSYLGSPTQNGYTDSNLSAHAPAFVPHGPTSHSHSGCPINHVFEAARNDLSPCAAAPHAGGYRSSGNSSSSASLQSCTSAEGSARRLVL
jgi:hypothetical protein